MRIFHQNEHQISRFSFVPFFTRQTSIPASRLRDDFVRRCESQQESNYKNSLRAGRDDRVSWTSDDTFKVSAKRVAVTSMAQTLQPTFLYPLNFLFYLEPIFDFNKTVQLINYVHVKCTTELPLFTASAAQRKRSDTVKRIQISSFCFFSLQLNQSFSDSRNRIIYIFRWCGEGRPEFVFSRSESEKAPWMQMVRKQKPRISL